MPQASEHRFHLQISKLPIFQIYDFSCVCRNKDVCRIQMSYGEHFVSIPNEKNKFYMYCHRAYAVLPLFPWEHFWQDMAKFCCQEIFFYRNVWAKKFELSDWRTSLQSNLQEYLEPVRYSPGSAGFSDEKSFLKVGQCKGGHFRRASKKRLLAGFATHL